MYSSVQWKYLFLKQKYPVRLIEDNNMQAVKHIDKDTFTQSIFDLDDSVGKGVRESHRLSLWPLVR
ncbi:Protein of unknown function [Pyronema omphalodes CBS 100304]|uniref:Uncharacterized protein n=1 Tax=Pyronema omphalodes (strain CBS 100304) TaxID=1076935 RepID=U4LP33_PYROM|nr:Protein of unknown function [Pyronema omphalodes CBS 100304]